MARKQQEPVQFTVRGVPPSVANALRKRAAQANKSLNSVLVEALTASAGIAGEPLQYRDLSDLAGLWVEDPEFDRIIAEQDQIDESMWG